MKLKWSKHWNASKRPSKQRKYRYNAPLHVQHTFLAAHLSPELRKKYTTRSFTLRKGDKVKILRGQHKKKTGKVSRILIKSQKIYIEGIELSKKDGSKVLIPLDLVITDLLKFARIRRETKKILNEGKIFVNGKVRKDLGYAVGLMDVMSIHSLNKDYRVFYDIKGKFKLSPLGDDEKDVRIVQIKNKTIISGKKIQ